MTAQALHYDSERRDILQMLEEAEGPEDVVWRLRQFAESRVNDLSFTVAQADNPNTPPKIITMRVHLIIEANPREGFTTEIK